MKRIFDVAVSLFLAIFLIIPLAFLALLVRLSSPGPALYWCDRVGQHNNLFKMPKFRTMYIGTPTVASDLLNEPKNYITPIGKFLRKTSIDELPQLWSIIIGDMSFVGPRPALFNQSNLIKLRTDAGVHKLLPGLVGLAQVNGRDEISINEKVNLDIEYIKNQSLLLDVKIIGLSLAKVLLKVGISH